MRRVFWLGGIAALALLLAWAPNAAASEQGSDAADDEEEHPMEGDDEPHFLTGLDFSYWADGDKTQYGPGLTWGLILVPDLLDLTLAFGAVIGDRTYTVPFELRFTVPFRVNHWFAPYLSAGPTLMFDELEGTWTHDFAASVSGGLEFTPPGFHWGIRVQGDYNLRFWQDVVHEGGFSAGFMYRF